jgi:hypothetical protein
MLKNLGTTTVFVMSAIGSQGCMVYSYDVVDQPSTVVVVDGNDAPYVFDAEAGVYWDDWSFDDVWYFDAYVDDYDSPYDVIGVWADVYDECSGGYLVHSFELYPTNDPSYWTVEAYGSSTFLDPFWDCYTVDFVAYDVYDDFGYLTVWAATY